MQILELNDQKNWRNGLSVRLLNTCTVISYLSDWLLILAILGFLPLVDHVLVFKNLKSIFSILTLCYLFGFRQKGQAKAKRECLNLMEMVRMYPFRISQLRNSLKNPLNC
jgi:hypothetical protein